MASCITLKYRLQFFFLKNYERLNLTELALFFGVIIGIIVAIVITIVFIRFRKNKGSYERKTTDDKGAIKIKEISKEELKKAKKEEKEKEKGRTEVSKDLIFSVPQWETDDEDND